MVAVAFTLLFGVTGALFSLASSLIVRLLPWVGLGVGVLLIIAGGMSLGAGPSAWTPRSRLRAKSAAMRPAPALVDMRRSGWLTGSLLSDVPYRCSSLC